MKFFLMILGVIFLLLIVGFVLTTVMPTLAKSIKQIFKPNEKDKK